MQNLLLAIRHPQHLPLKLTFSFFISLCLPVWSHRAVCFQPYSSLTGTAVKKFYKKMFDLLSDYGKEQFKLRFDAYSLSMCPALRRVRYTTA